MASVVGICNRALGKLGARSITELGENSPNARACNACYETLRDAELRKHQWNFSIDRAELAAASPDPTWGRAKQYPLPSSYIRLANDYPEDNTLSKDFEIEGRYILSDHDAPVRIRFVARITDPNEMDPLFREALATKMAIEMCEQLTQSNTKKEGLKDDYAKVIAEAKRANAIERISAIPPEDPWLTCRR